MLTMAALLVAICRPYKKTYMNVLDSLLLAYMGLVCHLMSAEHSFSVRENVAYTFDVVLAFPFFCFTMFFVVKALKKFFIRKSHICRLLSEKCKLYFSHFEFQESHSRFNSPPSDEVLVDPASTEASYGTYR